MGHDNDDFSDRNSLDTEVMDFSGLLGQVIERKRAARGRKPVLKLKPKVQPENGPSLEGNLVDVDPKELGPKEANVEGLDRKLNLEELNELRLVEGLNLINELKLVNELNLVGLINELNLAKGLLELLNERNLIKKLQLNQWNELGSNAELLTVNELAKLNEGDVQAHLKPKLNAQVSVPNTASDQAPIANSSLDLQLKHERYRFQLQKELQTDSAIDLLQIDRIYSQKLAIQIRKYIKHLVNTWDLHLQQTSDHQQLQILSETKRDLVKLLYKLRSEKLNDNMLISLATICYYLQQKNYNKATESYLKLSIGNVAWPIGVKSVGIHSRSADLKITGEDKLLVANIMIDDKTRRWITAIKRLIAFCERNDTSI